MFKITYVILLNTNNFNLCNILFILSYINFCFLFLCLASLKYPATFHSFVSTYVGLCGCRQRVGFGKLYFGGGGGGVYTKCALARARYPGGVQKQPICLIISAPRGGPKNTHFCTFLHIFTPPQNTVFCTQIFGDTHTAPRMSKQNYV